MKVRINGSWHEIEEGTTVLQMLEQHGWVRDGIAVAINTEVVPRSQHAEHVIVEGDKIEVIQAVGGG